MANVTTAYPNLRILSIKTRRRDFENIRPFFIRGPSMEKFLATYMEDTRYILVDMFRRRDYQVPGQLEIRLVVPRQAMLANQRREYEAMIQAPKEILQRAKEIAAEPFLDRVHSFVTYYSNGLSYMAPQTEQWLESLSTEDRSGPYV